MNRRAFIIAIALYCGVVRVLGALEIDLEPDPTDTTPPPAAAVEALPPPPTIDEAEFKKDPLIKEALRIFEAKITKKS